MAKRDSGSDRQHAMTFSSARARRPLSPLSGGTSMAREVRRFASREQLTSYLIQEAGRSAELAAEAVAIAVEDGVVLLDNAKIFGFRAWEITYDSGTFRVVHEFGYLTASGEVI